MTVHPKGILARADTAARPNDRAEPQQFIPGAPLLVEVLQDDQLT